MSELLQNYRENLLKDIEFVSIKLNLVSIDPKIEAEKLVCMYVDDKSLE